MSYRLFGAETSAYSTKMRSYLEVQGRGLRLAAPHPGERGRTQDRSPASPTLPVLVTASGFAVHDTTPMMEALEADSPEPSATPADPATAFLACVLEEYADVWLAKAAFHYRWTRKKDQRLAAARSIEDYYAARGAGGPQGRGRPRHRDHDRADQRHGPRRRARRRGREILQALHQAARRPSAQAPLHLRRPALDRRLRHRRPADPDAEGSDARQDHREGRRVRRQMVRVHGRAHRVRSVRSARRSQGNARADLRGRARCAFLPWAAENLENSLAGNETFEVTLGKETFQLAPLRSAARSFRELRRKFVTGQTIEPLKAFTDETASTVYLLRPQRSDFQPRPPREEAAPDEAISEGADSGEGEGLKPRPLSRRPRTARAHVAASAAAAEAADAARAAVPKLPSSEATGEEVAAALNDMGAEDADNDAGGDAGDNAGSDGDSED